MKKLILLFLLACLITKAYSQAPAKPFPQHYVYTAGSILPNNHTQTQLDANTKTFYDQWKAVYLKNDCGSNQYYVWFQDPPTICVSEGQGYGMVITAYMAGYDANAKTYFDGLYNFYQAHKSNINNNLMAWEQITGCTNNPSGGNDAATDGDLDIAYGLLLAHYQWGSTGTINYLQKAKDIIAAIMQSEVNSAIFTTKLGDWVGTGSSQYNDTRCSDFIMDHFRAFQIASGNANWNNVVDKCYSIVNAMQTNFSATTGLLPDFVVKCNTTPVPASPNYLEGPLDGHYSYNSCRTPWRIGTDYLISGDARAKTALDKINAWIRNKTSNNPANIESGYYLNGNTTGNNYDSEAFVAPFAVGAMANSINQTWLNSTYDHLIGMQLANTGYYENSIKMLTLIVLSSNWWIPVPTATAIEYPNAFDFSVYPTLIERGQNTVTVNLNLQTPTTLSVALVNALGQVISVQESRFDAGSNQLPILINREPAGVYYLRVNSREYTVCKKIVVM